MLIQTKKEKKLLEEMCANYFKKHNVEIEMRSTNNKPIDKDFIDFFSLTFLRGLLYNDIFLAKDKFIWKMKQYE